MTFQQILDKSKLTQSQLATKMSVHQTTISNWKLKKVTPAIAQMQKLADALEVDLQTIVACFVQDQKNKKE